MSESKASSNSDNQILSPFLATLYLENGQAPGLKSFIFLSLRIFFLLGLFLLLEWGIMQTAQLEQDHYYQPLIIIELAKNLVGPQLFIFLPILVIMIGYKSLWKGWSSFESTSSIRWFITLVAVIMAWSFSTYDYNLYFNQGHYLDRVLLLVLVPCIYWRPFFVFPFILQLISVIWQFNYPLGGYSVAEQFLLVRILILFLAVLVLKPLSGSRKINDFIFISLTLLASSYWWPGVGKIRLNWIAHGHLYLLMFATYAKGWLAFLDPTIIETLGKVFSWLDWPMRLGTLLLEFGALFALWRRASLIFFLAGWPLFHLGVFAMSGIFFWKWVLLDALILTLFLRNKRFRALPIFTRGHFVLSIILIGGCPLWFKPVNLSWYDSGLSYADRTHVIGVSGKEYTLSPHFFAPYDYKFTVGGFNFFSREPRLSITWGSTRDPVVATALRKASSPEEFLAIESKFGKIRYRPETIDKLDKFLIRFFTNLNARGSKKTWLSPIRSPAQLWTFPRGNAFTNQEKIAKLVIYQITAIFDGTRYIEIRKQLIHELDIPLNNNFPPPSK